MNWTNFILHAFDSLNASDMVRRIGWMLIHGIWQGLAAAIALRGALALMRGRDGLHAANLRYLLACGAMIVVLGSAIATFVLSGEPKAIAAPEKIAPPPAIAPVARIDSTPSPILPATPPRKVPLMPIIVVCWTVGVILLGTRQFLGWVAVQRLRWSVPLREAAWTNSLSDMSRRMGIQRVVRLLASPRVGVPVVLGTIRPAIVIPLSIVSGLSTEHVSAILAHELAHVRRHDYLVNLIQTAMETIFFHHPAVRWISGQIRGAREDCCDDLAIAACGSRLEYTKALVTLEEKCRPAQILAPAATDGSLVRRVRRLLASPKPRSAMFRNHAMRRNLAAAIVVMLVVLPIGAEHFWHSKSQMVLAGEPATRPTSRPAASQKLRAGDVITVTVIDHLSQNSGVKTCKIDDSGNISLPFISTMSAAGMTPEELEKAITQKYIDAKLASDPKVTVELVEPKAETRPAGPRKLQAGDEISVSIMDLMGEETGETVQTCKISESGNIRVPLIPPIPAAGLTPEELRKEIARRYSDANLLRNPQITVDWAAPDVSVRVTVYKDGKIAVDGAPGNWDTLRDRLAKLSPGERAKTIIVLVVDGDIPFNIVFQQVSAALKLVDDLKLASVSVAGINHDEPRPAATQPSSQIFIRGNVQRPGVYELGDHRITIKQFLDAAGGLTEEDESQSLTLTRRTNGAETFPLRDVKLSALMNGDQADLYLEPDDELLVAAVATKNSAENPKP